MLDPAQVHHLALDRELLASTAGIRHFWYMLKENKFTSVNDRQGLIYALHRVTGGWTARQECHLSYTAEFHQRLMTRAGSGERDS